MAVLLRSRSWVSALLFVFCVCAAFAACSGGSSTGGVLSGSGSGSASGGGHPSGSGSGGTGGGNLFNPDGGMGALTVTPSTAALKITKRNSPKTAAFKALLDGQETSDVSWSLDTYDVGNISTSGDFATTGIVGGKVTVTATHGQQKASAVLTVNVDISEDVKSGPTDPGVSLPNKTALEGTPQPDPGASATPPNATKILYPYDKTVMPRGLTAPLLQFSPGNIPPQDALVAMSSTYFSWAGFIHVSNSTTPQFSIPQDVWDAALESAGGTKLTIAVTKASVGVAYGPATTSILVAPGSLTGAVYYMTYDTANGANGLWSARPGVKQPATQIIAGCLVCHAVSANGTKLVVGADDSTLAAQAGIYNVGSDGKAKKIIDTPASFGLNSNYPTSDQRGLSFATLTPDGKYLMRGQTDFWGGADQTAWKIDDVNNVLTPATIVGLDNVSAFVPAISPDSKHYAFTNGDGDAFGTPRQSVSSMDLAINAKTDTLTFSNRKLLHDNGATGNEMKFINFLPDPDYMVLEEASNACAAYGGMLPSWDATCGDYSYTGSTGRLFMLRASSKEYIELKNLNLGNNVLDRDRNYEPFPLQVTAGGYFWVVFTSIREYGNTYTNADGTVQKQLWVAAISTNPGPGEDPSHPPFYLPNQSDTRNERGFWALEPCKADGASCQTGDECCDGFCRPSNQNNPSSPLVCNASGGGCSQASEKCTTTSDCCDAATGTTCIGGFCSPKSPN